MTGQSERQKITGAPTYREVFGSGPIAREVMQWINDGNDSAVRYQDQFIYSRTLAQALAAGARHDRAFRAAQGATLAELADYAVNSRLAWFRYNRQHYLALRDAAALVGCEGVAE